ncbi:hypothetical protein TRFO_41353 [Tritrichomonas foetus]|uniref:Uncharacterized protein n=1 Tax=Tritrichomonas foetus TaxID=1144522 RepID=A0A1J4L542_9EUKA|nr:hypothetical protein TRFO_41353 [Tritrichomonas foetus]|eukprot:OHT17054.1 hypothetical protein TRFO_41353 [Tritrichomonas foetus]
MIEIVDDSSSSSKNSESSCKDEEESHQQSSISIHSKQLQTKEKVIAKNENEFQIVIEPKTESEPKTEIDTTIGNEEGFDEEDQKLRSFTLMKLPDLPYPTICNKFSFENQIQYKEPSKKLQFKAPNFPKKDEQLNQKSCSNQNYQKSPKNMSNDEPLSDKFGIIAAMQKSKSQSQSSTIISENEKHLRYQKRSFPKITEKIEETKSFEIFSKYIESLNNQCP